MGEQRRRGLLPDVRGRCVYQRQVKGWADVQGRNSLLACDLCHACSVMGAMCILYGRRVEESDEELLTMLGLVEFDGVHEDMQGEVFLCSLEHHGGH